MQTSLADALTLARRGEARGFDALYGHLAGPITRLAHARATEDPEGLANDVMLKVFQRLPTFRGEVDEFRGWVFTIARNRTIDDARRRARRPQTTTQDHAPVIVTADSADAVIERLEQEWVHDTLAILTDAQREVILLRVIGDLTVADIARVIGKPIGAVKALQRRGLRSLKREIAGDPYPSVATRRWTK